MLSKYHRMIVLTLWSSYRRNIDLQDEFYSSYEEKTCLWTSITEQTHTKIIIYSKEHYKSYAV